MLSKSCIYAIRSVIFVAQNASIEAKMGFKTVAKGLDLPESYTGKLLQKLTAKNILHSIKGPKGGFYATPQSLKTPIIKIIEVIDGLAYFHTCGMGLKECSDSHPCPLHHDLKVIRDGLFDIYSSRTIGDLMESVNEGESHIVNL